VEVIAEVPEGPPMRFTWRRASHRVTRAEGPERIAAEWWRADTAATPRTRDYYRVEDEAGRRYWLYREGLYGEEFSGEAGEAAAPRWFVQGLFG
jgi:protein ImuB